MQRRSPKNIQTKKNNKALMRYLIFYLLIKNVKQSEKSLENGKHQARFFIFSFHGKELIMSHNSKLKKTMDILK